MFLSLSLICHVSLCAGYTTMVHIFQMDRPIDCRRRRSAAGRRSSLLLFYCRNKSLDGNTDMIGSTTGFTNFSYSFIEFASMTGKHPVKRK